MQSVVLLCLAALVGVSSAATWGSVIIFPFNKGGDKLGGCDDCMTKAVGLHLNPIYMDSKAYNAFAVHSNGYVTLYNSTDDKVKGYSYIPASDITEVSGPPILAALWSDVDLYCLAGRENNTVFYEESNNKALIYMASTLVMHNVFGHFEPRAYWNHYGEEFDPQSLLIVTWNNVQPYDCPVENGETKTNRFQMVLLTDRSQRRTFMIVFFRHLTWIQASGYTSGPAQFPTVGFTDGLNQGFGVDLDGGDYPLDYWTTGRPDYGIRVFELSEGIEAEEESDKTSTTSSPSTEEEETSSSDEETSETSPSTKARDAVVQEEILLQVFDDKRKH